MLLPAPGTAHQEAVGTIYVALRSWAELAQAGRVLLSPLMLRLGERDVLQPDLCFVLAGRQDMVEADGLLGVPDLVVEVLAPATIERDRVLKRAAYQRHGVPEYWLLDPASKSIEVLIRGEGGLQPCRVVPYTAVLAPELVPACAGRFTAPLLGGPSAAPRTPQPLRDQPGLPPVWAPPLVPAPDAGTRPAAEGPSWERLSSEYLESCRQRGLRPSTLHWHEYTLGGFSRWYLGRPGAGPLVAKAVSPADVLAYRSWLAARHRPTTTNSRLMTLRALFEWAFAQDYLPFNPAAAVRRLQQAELGPRTLRRDEVRRLLAVAARRSPRNAALIVLLLNTGLRLREVVALNWTDLTLGEGSGSLRIPRGKVGSYQDLPLNATACACLTRWRARSRAGEGPLPAPVFTDPAGRALSMAVVRDALRRYSRAAGIEPSVNALTLRDTFCKMLIEQGISLERVRLLAGHARIKSTLRYTRPTSEDLARDVGRLDWT